MPLDRNERRAREWKCYPFGYLTFRSENVHTCTGWDVTLLNARKGCALLAGVREEAFSLAKYQKDAVGGATYRYQAQHIPRG